MKKRRKVIRRILSTVLVLSMFAEPALSDYVNITSGGRVSAEETDAVAQTASGEYIYISDIRLYPANGRTRDAVAKAAEEEGYILFSNKNIPVDIKSATSEAPMYVGYKTTDDEDDAITSIKTLEMGRGYEWFDYQKIAEGQMEKMEVVANDLMIAINEFKENLKNGSESAKMAKDYLNYMYFRKDGKVKMGDYLSSDSVDAQTIKTFVIQMNGGSLSSMYSQLGLGIADVGETWADRIEKTETYTTKEVTTSRLAVWDLMYYEYALEMLPVLKDFAVKYRKAELRKNANSGEVVLADVDSDSHTPTTENADAIVEASQTDESGDIIYEVAYNMLNEHSIGDNKVGDYLLAVAESSYTKRTDYRKIYPFIEALTDGQYGIMKYIGVAMMATYMNQSDDFYNELEDRKSEVEETIYQATGGDSDLYIFEGVNTEFYTRKVALTSAGYRESNASNLYIDITKQGSFYEDMNLAFMTIGLASSVSAVITCSVYLGLLIAGSELTVWAACTSIIGTGVFASIAGVIGCAAVIVGYVALAAIVIAAIVYFVKWLYDQLSDDDDKEEYTTMPTEIYDIDQVTIDGKKKMSYVKYDVVKGSSGKPQDLHNNDGKRWVLMYCSKNPNLGSPVCVDKDGRVFTHTVDNVDTPSGYEPIAKFGEKSAHNLNSYSATSVSHSIYLHYRTKDQIEGTIYQETATEKITEEDVSTEVEENKGKIVPLSKTEKYLYGLMVSSEKSESAAKAAITMNTGYKIYDKNLSPGNGYTYIGYASTTVKSDAITDIRIVPNFNGDSAALGDAGYSTAGRLPDGSAICYTRYKSAGSPIIDTLKVTTKRESISSPLEPVNMLCGGEAYNLTGKRKSPLYLYFKPSVSYTSGEQYISGLRFISGRKGEATRTRDALGKDVGMSAFNCNFAPYSLYGSQEKYYFRKSVKSGHGTSHITSYRTLNYGNYELYLYYSFTYNPYRAIYDVKAYTATPKMKGLQVSVGTTEGSYAVVENTCISDSAFYVGSFDEDKPTQTKPTNTETIKTLASRTYIDVSLGSNNYNKRGTTNYKLEKNITWGSSPYRSQGLYVLGHTARENYKPLRKSDIVVTNDSAKIAGMRSVQRFTDPYNEDPINLAYQDPSKSSKGVYIFLKGEAKKKGRYISGITVKTYKRPEDTEKRKLSDDEKKEYDKMADDMCRMGLLSQIDGEVLNYNIGINQSEAWYNKVDGANGTASYIGVSRTDEENYAITGLLMYKATTLPPIKVSVNGIEYHRVGDKFGNYYLYYTKSPGANPGVPVEDISFDTNPVIKGQATAVGITGQAREPKADYMERFSGQNGYLHMKTNTESSIVSDIKVLSGDMAEVVPKFMSEGFNCMITESLNAHAGGNNVYVAYKTISSELFDIEEEDLSDTDWDMEGEDWDDMDDDWDFDDEDWSDFDIDFDDIIFDDLVVRDIICRVAKEPVEEFTNNGATYYLISDISLNSGLDGSPSIYMYYTLDESINVGGKPYMLPAIESVAMTSGDSVPSRENDTSRFGQWEMLLNDEGKEVNMNEGVIARDDDHIKDCRLFLFVKRHKGGIKPGTEIIRGAVQASTRKIDIYIKK